MRIKKIGAIIIAMLFTIINLSMTSDISYAKEVKTSGKYFNVSWNYDEATNTLTITGKGEIKDWIGDECGYYFPWLDFDTKIDSIVIGEGITHIGAFAFECFPVTAVTLPDSLVSIGYCAFSGCENLKSVTLPEKLEEIGSSAFSGCNSLKEIVIPDSVKSIREYIFCNCENLVSVTLSKNLKELPSEMFRVCPKLELITIRSGKIKKIGKRAFTGIFKPTVIEVPKNKLKTYRKMFYKAGLSKEVKITSLIN